MNRAWASPVVLKIIGTVIKNNFLPFLDVLQSLAYEASSAVKSDPLGHLRT
jgi:hypothetical protein